MERAGVLRVLHSSSRSKRRLLVGRFVGSLSFLSLSLSHTHSFCCCYTDATGSSSSCCLSNLSMMHDCKQGCCCCRCS